MSETFTREQILSNAALQSELLRMSSQPHDLEDGGMYIPPRRFSPAVTARARDMMATLGVEDVMQLTDMALQTVFWAIGERMAGKLVGSVNITDDFETSPLPFLMGIDSGEFSRQ